MEQFEAKTEELNRFAEYVFKFKDEQRKNSVSFPNVQPTVELHQLQEWFEVCVWIYNSFIIVFSSERLATDAQKLRRTVLKLLKDASDNVIEPEIVTEIAGLSHQLRNLFHQCLIM